MYTISQIFIMGYAKWMGLFAPIPYGDPYIGTLAFFVALIPFVFIYKWFMSQY